MKKSYLLVILSLGILALLQTTTHAESTDTSQSNGAIVAKPGDTVYSLASQYNVSPESLIQSNNLSDPNLIYSGQQLTVAPGAGSQQSQQGNGADSANASQSDANASQSANASDQNTDQNASGNTAADQANGNNNDASASDKNANNADGNKDSKDSNKDNNKKDNTSKLPEQMLRKWYVGKKNVLEITKDEVKLNGQTEPLDVTEVPAGKDGQSGPSYKLTKQDDKTVYWLSKMKVEGEEHTVLKSNNSDKKEDIKVYTQHPTKQDATYQVKDNNEKSEIGK